MRKKSSIFLFCVILSGCHTSQTNFIAPSSFPLWAKSHHEYSIYTHQAIVELAEQLQTIQPRDVSQFCSKYLTLTDRNIKIFWTNLVSAIAKKESNNMNDVMFTENLTDNQGNAVISRGLLQISFESAKGYRCLLKTPNDLHNPKMNLRCGVKILNHWIGKDERIAGRMATTRQWRGGARYWSVLRRNSTLKSIQSVTNNLSFCRDTEQSQ